MLQTDRQINEQERGINCSTGRLQNKLGDRYNKIYTSEFCLLTYWITGAI